MGLRQNSSDGELLAKSIELESMDSTTINFANILRSKVMTRPLHPSCCDSILHRFFRLLGERIGQWPKICISIGILLLLISFVGFRSIKLHQNLKSGFTSENAPSIKEYAALQKYFGNRGQPFYMALFARGKTEKNMLRNKNFFELKKVYDYITKKMDITVGNQTLHYNDICGQFCNFNKIFWKIMDARNYYGIDLQYPITRAYGKIVNIGRHFFGNENDENGNLKRSDTLALWFHTFEDNNETKAAFLKQFELTLWKFIGENETQHIDLYVHGASVIGKEVLRGGKTVGPLYLSGLVAVFLFVLICFLLNSSVQRQLDCAKPLLAFLAVLCPILAAISAMGFILLFGYHLNMLILIAPILVLAIGIGVDDAFLLMNSWIRISGYAEVHKRSASERMGLVFAEVGPSVVMTSVTNCLAFAFGAIAPIPEIQLFCFCVSMAMFLDLMYHLLIFSPCMVLLSYCEHKRSSGTNQESKGGISDILKNILGAYCRFIASWFSKILALLILALYLFGAISGIYAMKVNFDGHLIIPEDSQSNVGLEIMETRVWPTYQAAVFIVQKPPDFSDPDQYGSYLSMVTDLESLPRSVGSDVTMYWAKDYVRFITNGGKDVFDALFDDEEKAEVEKDLKMLNMSRFTEFISTSPYDGWKKGVHWIEHEDGSIEITEMLLMVGYQNITSLGEKSEMLGTIRAEIENHPQFDLRQWDPDSQIADVILSVVPTTTKTIFITIATMAIIFLIFVPNLLTVICAVASVTSIATGVVGYLHWWGCFLDPLTMTAVVMTVGLSVDYTAHISYHYHRTSALSQVPCSSKTQRLYAAFRSVAIPMLEAGVSTFICLAPVLFSPVGVYVVIAKSITLVVILGLFHGLFFIPVLLTVFPSSWTGSNFFYTPQLLNADEE